MDSGDCLVNEFLAEDFMEGSFSGGLEARMWREGRCDVRSCLRPLGYGAAGDDSYYGCHATSPLAL